MTDILIKGMEMPKDGQKMYMITFSDGKACVSHKPFEWHEVIPVPPHRRLVDADAIRTDIDEKRPGRSYEDAWTLTVIDAAPTIIPAEEEN